MVGIAITHSHVHILFSVVPENIELETSVLGVLQSIINGSKAISFVGPGGAHLKMVKKEREDNDQEFEDSDLKQK